MVNGTKSDWVKKDQHSYQMNSWNFPDTVQAMSSASVYVEWNQAPFHEWGDDGGEATYLLQGADMVFQVQARGRSEFHLQIDFTSIATHGNPSGSVLNLGWIHNGAVNFILSGEPGCLNSSNPPGGTAGRPCVYAFLAISRLRPESSAIAGYFCLRQDAAEPFDESFPVLVVFKYPPLFYPTTNDVVQRSRSVCS